MTRNVYDFVSKYNTYFVTEGQMRGLPQLPSFYSKSQVSGSHKHWKALQGVLQQGVAQGESFNKDLF
jgi:hypothetical protein